MDLDFSPCYVTDRPQSLSEDNAVGVEMETASIVFLSAKALLCLVEILLSQCSSVTKHSVFS